MKQVILTLFGLFLLPLQVYAVQNVNLDNRVGVGKEESQVQQGKEVKLDQVEVFEATESQGKKEIDEEFIENEKEEYEKKPELQEQIQNRGEDQQIQTKNQQTGTEDGLPGIGNQVREMAVQQAGKAAQNMMQQMAQNMGEEMGLGEQVRQLAQEQNQVQDKIDDNLQKVRNRNRFLKFILGPDKKALDELQNRLEENQQIIEELENIAPEADPTAQEQIQSVKQILGEQNSYLEETIQAEQKTKGIFSFLTTLFS
jgi:hypothetical protein